MQIKIVNKSEHPDPSYKSKGASGMDIQANLSAPVKIEPGERVLIPTGLFVEIPIGFEAQIRPRSGLALNHGITLLNAPGTIDSDYRGEIKILLINLSKNTFTVQNGDRIAQMVVAANEHVEWIKTSSLTPTSRGEKGYGSTGTGI